jgi:hypothetical protein
MFRLLTQPDALITFECGFEDGSEIFKGPTTQRKQMTRVIFLWRRDPRPTTEVREVFAFCG